MARKMEIEFSKGEKLVAELYDEEAPATCNYVWDRLPFTSPAKQNFMSGGNVEVYLYGWTFNKLEYANPGVPRDEIGLLSRWIPHSPENKPFCKILVGGTSEVHEFLSMPTPVNRFAKIVEGLDQLTVVRNRLTEEGTQGTNITFRKK